MTGPVLSMPEIPAFQTEQYRFTAYIRDPTHHPLPENMEERRMAIYQDLVYNNVESLLAGNFPVLYSILDMDCWHGLVRDFFRKHRCQTPIFAEIAEEFLGYLQGQRSAQPKEPAFMLELVHYEWVEMALAIDENEIYGQGYDPNGDLLAGIPVLSPLAWPLAYHYPVHQIGPDFQPDTPPEQATYLLIYRSREDDVGFMEINAITFRLLTLLGNDEIMTGAQICTQIATEMQHPTPKTVLAGGEEILNQLKRRDVILGAKA